MRQPMKLLVSHLVIASALSAGCSKGPAATAAPTDATAAPTSAASPGQAPGQAEQDPSSPDPSSDPSSDPLAASTGDGDSSSQPGSGQVAAAGPLTDEYGAVAVAKNPRAEVTKTSKWAKVKVEIRTPSGKVFKDTGKSFPYDQLTRLDFDFEGISHTFLIDLSRDGKSNAAVKLTYIAGGEEVVRNYGFDAKLSKREVLRLDDGTALALTVSNKTIKPLPAEVREQLEGADNDRDPLSGQ